MYSLSDLIDGSIAGELQNLNIQTLDKSAITPNGLKQFIAVLNAGLTDLHKRFMLKKASVQLSLQEDVRLYTLTSLKAESKGYANPYIKDSVELPFTDNVMEVLAVYKGKDEIRLGAKGGIYLSTPQTLYLDFVPTEGTLLDVVYKATHARVPSDADLDTQVLIPPSHVQALYYYIGARIMTAQTTGLATIEGRAFHEGSHYMKLYEQECQRLSDLGIDAESNNVVSLFTQRGFI